MKGYDSLKEIEKLTSKSILEESIFIELFEIEDEIKKARRLLALTDRAEELGVKTKFNNLLRAYKKVEKEMKKKNNHNTAENWTHFIGPYEAMRCGKWVAEEEGIYIESQNAQGMTEVLACYHPILPIERLKNLETGEEQIKLAYKRNQKWQEIIVPKELVATASKITTLSRKGVSVTSENAKYLVKYLSDVENFNENSIQVQYSTSKLGWIGKNFIPYDKELVFDGDSRFKQVFESIKKQGERENWYEHVIHLRAIGRLEVKFMLAASFASVLVNLLGGLPFFIDLWGETEGGKSVTLMLACSVWANPAESQYIGDFKTTDVALEARADLLNHLPMILDDTSKTSARIKENFEGIVYDLCSGKGKSRSNKELGINRENHWRNAILTNGERPLTSYVQQGGAINRILEVECGEKVYPDPKNTAELLKKHYGFAGEDFIQIIKELGLEKIKEMQQEFLTRIYDDEKMQKQSLSLSIILTADKIATEYLFQDGNDMELEEARQVLIDRNELSDNERCYQYILSEIAINKVKFDPNITMNERWGVIEHGYAVIYNNVFDTICKKGGFEKKAFFSWARKHDFIQTQAGKSTKVKRIDGSYCRCVFLKLDKELEEEPEKVDFTLLSKQEKLPF